MEFIYKHATQIANLFVIVFFATFLYAVFGLDVSGPILTLIYSSFLFAFPIVNSVANQVELIKLCANGHSHFIPKMQLPELTLNPKKNLKFASILWAIAMLALFFFPPFTGDRSIFDYLSLTLLCLIIFVEPIVEYHVSTWTRRKFQCKMPQGEPDALLS